MKKLKTLLYGAALLVPMILTSGALLAQPLRAKDPLPSSQTIRLALLLDTSNSMDGLIDQAKSQLWKIVNELSAAKCSDGAHPSIRIALYEYGNSKLAQRDGYIRMVSGMTGDLDLISEKLFALTTDGGEEYCGQVIRTSLNQLAWQTNTADLNMIFIAGNEPFTQGEIPYASACSLAKEKGVVVNTIFCGNFDEGLRTDWKRGADLTGGSYMSIEQNRKTVFIATPYDDQIDAKNEALNKTYVYYGSSGAAAKENQSRQDNNSMSYGKSNKVERAISKSSAAYNNTAWDLVDATQMSDTIIGKIDTKDLPPELKGLSVEKRKAYIHQKSLERDRLKTDIQVLSKKRQEYITANTKKEAGVESLDDAMLQALKKKAVEKKMSWR